MGKSARIQRRETCKTGEIPEAQYWSKTTEYGNYLDPLQNYKFNGGLNFKNDEKSTLKAINKQRQMLHQCKALGTHGKHAGSKKHSRIKRALNGISKMIGAYNSWIKGIKDVSNTDKQQ